MMPDHERIEELLAGQALDGLDAGDERELRAAREAHGECGECARLERELREVAGLLAFSLTPAPVDRAIADRITRGGDAASALPDAPVSGDELAARRARTTRGSGRGARRSAGDGRRSQVWTAIVGVAAVAAAAIVLTTTVGRPPVQVTSADVAGRVVRFDGGVDGSLTMAYTPGERGAVFWGHGLPDPGEGRTYEIWMIDDGTPVPGGCTTPVDGRIALFVPAEIGTTELMAVTVEPTECPSEPTTDPVLTAELEPL
ncbi:MAG TPA: anti-sigma factor [Actinomycetota bacterium]|nr:anti-sigma factor [Actinomycetota bacterium]